MTQASLAERLGYGPRDRLLIVNCDDLGASHSANVATRRALVSGAISKSASLMVPCPHAYEAAQMLKDHPIGIHLTVTSEYRSHRWSGLTEGASLYDDRGFLWQTRDAALAHLTVADAHAECRAQIAAALAWGLDVSHLDTHMNVLQERSDLYDVLLDLAVEFRLPVRMFPRHHTEAQGFHAPERAQARGIVINDHMIDRWPEFTLDILRDEIPKLPPGVTVIYAHPVDDGEELRGYDYPHLALLRASDAACVCNAGIAALLDQHNVRCIGFRELRDLQRQAG